MSKPLHYWIKERHNPQLGVYYVAEGQRTKAEAKRMESGSLYGFNIMHGFPTAEAYEARLTELRAAGERVQ